MPDGRVDVGADGRGVGREGEALGRDPVEEKVFAVEFAEVESMADLAVGDAVEQSAQGLFPGRANESFILGLLANPDGDVEPEATQVSNEVELVDRIAR